MIQCYILFLSVEVRAFFVNLGDCLLDPVLVFVKLGDSVLHSVVQC